MPEADLGAAPPLPLAVSTPLCRSAGTVHVPCHWASKNDCPVLPWHSQAFHSQGSKPGGHLHRIQTYKVRAEISAFFPSGRIKHFLRSMAMASDQSEERLAAVPVTERTSPSPPSLLISVLPLPHARKGVSIGLGTDAPHLI